MRLLETVVAEELMLMALATLAVVEAEQVNLAEGLAEQQHKVMLVVQAFHKDPEVAVAVWVPLAAE